MMKTDDSEEEYLLVGKTSLEELLAPIKRSARLRYNCISVSQRLVALGSNTGGIYVFSRLDKKLLQIAFADKETNSVSIVKFSPHGKFVAFASGSSVHVLDLKLETRSKAETLRSSSDLGVAMATYLHWDETNSKLYVGDDSGGIHLMTVHTNKAKNLFSLPLEVIMKLDSGVVQIDSVDDRLLVSTLTRHTYTQIGKKLRDGSYGSCFLHVGDSTMIYSARPGSRVWEVDYEGAVLNTHQFRQLLAIPPSPVLNLLSPNLLLTWTTSSIYVLDPINVKVILWCNQFSGIVDVACVGQELFVFLQTMEVQCVSFLPVTVVIPLYMRLSNVETAADLCLRHREIFMHKHVRKRFATADLLKICNQLVGIELNEKAEKIHELIKEIEQKTVVDVDLESSESSGKICSASLFSDIQEIVVEPQNQRNNDTHNQVQHKATKHTSANNKDEIEIQSSNLKENTNFGRNLDVGIKLDSIIEGTDTVGNGQHATSVNGFYNTYNTTGSDHILGESNEEMQGSTHTPNVVEDESAYEIQEMTQQTNVLNEESVDVFDMMGEMNNLPLDDTTGYTQSNSDCEENKLTSISQTDSPRILVNSAALVAENDSSNVREEYPIEQDSKTLNITDCNIETEITAEAKQMAEDEMFMENDVLGLLPAKVLLPRRSSLTSLSSMSSAEVMFDQPTTLEEGDEDQIAVPVRRKTGRKKKRRSVGDVVTRQGRRHSSAGSLQADTASPRDGSLAMLDDGSSPSVSGLIGGEEDSISLYSNNSVNLEDGVCTHALARDTPDSASLDQTIDTLSLGSPMSASGDHGYSGEFGRSDEFLQSGESYTGESKQRGATLTSAAPKAAFKQFKDKVQNKMSTKTKTLIKNIKDKNLLTKAKEFAENLSQGSENYLNSIEGMITELPSGRNNNDVEASLSEETYSSTEVDGHDKMPVCDTDCGASNGEESCSCSNTGINGDAKETVIGCAERELTSTSVVTNCDKSASHIRDDMSKTFMNTFQTVTVCDKVEQTQHEHIEQNGNTQEKEKILNMQSSENDVNQASVPEERPSSVEVGKEVQDKEMGFFLRCYFPYMQVGKVRADVLSGRAGYHTWTAIITCMEVLAAYDSERYGVEQRSIIGHLLENQAHLDHGAALVGHVAREAVFAGLHKHMSLLLSWLEMLLSDGLNEADTRTMQGQSRVMSHQLQWKHGGQLAKLTQCVELTSVPDVLDLFYKYRYWVGVLKLLKMSGRHRDHLTLVLQLRDRKLISGTSEIGYMPHSAEEWKELLLLYKSICVDQSEDATDSDLLTWSSLAILLVRYVGPEGAVSLLEECQVPDGVLSPEFFQTCLLSGLVNNYQRKVLHAMLEKVDSYLWSQRPTAVTPQGGYLCSEGDPAYQTEDPECHWGIKTRINKVCLCCNISLMEAVSHDDPGVLIFKCVMSKIIRLHIKVTISAIKEKNVFNIIKNYDL
ncbi:HPS5-like protein [Mya arenaria]|uniref:HPS5-like protein n=1 Tax=Mya arenaria TaxID=6604 RepID=A0ABY7E160_MYAAR|nr:HPS5-like protein [Mya arenaria]